ncbi:MAG: NAD(P)/FAD-dependent oxidoreductase, partial [Gammaproteobacteria bacterium]
GIQVAPFGGAAAAPGAPPAQAAISELALDELLVFYGLSPRLGPIAEWGLDGDRRHIIVAVETCATSEPGVYAIGDISTYPGKKKLILSGFHEAAMAAYAIQKHLDPQAKGNVQYTTTSSELQQRLGVRDG